MAITRVGKRTLRPVGRPLASGFLAALAVGALAASPAGAAPTRSHRAHSGPVDVLSAGSLQDLMADQVAPAFERATGYTLDNMSMGSSALAASISGGTLQGDVFISASPSVNASLEGPSNGGWVSWYDQFASSPLVLGYNPQSRFAHLLTTEPWYQVVARPGFLLGRTDPATDPKGVLAVEALHQVARAHGLRSLGSVATDTKNVFPETALVGELQSGQLDAGFFYAVEAAAAKLKTVPLTGTHLAGAYTITILNKSPHTAAAISFVNFLLGEAGRRILAANGVVPTPPRVTGLQFAPIGVAAVLR